MTQYEGQEIVTQPELPLEHFTLQLQYAQKAMEISRMPIERALMEYTQYWRRVGNKGWSFDPNTPTWGELITRIYNGEPADIVAYDLYSRRTGIPEEEQANPYFGCFRFDFNPEFDGDVGVIKIHFKNKDTSGVGPLSKERQSERFEELRLMFNFIMQNYPQAQVVHGGSWVYNLEAYRRLFPASYTENMRVEETPFPRTAGIWGQFLNSEGMIKDDVAKKFLEKTRDATSLDELLQCFEFKILFPRGIIEDFYKQFGLI
jgi:hypothetical protein